MTDRHLLIRDAEAWDAIELLLVSAIASILCIRGYLVISGYPTLGGERLHIAHMLWGGLFMLAALLLLLIYWNPSMRRLAAFTAGLGFGTFIDELGKFVTHDNDYFFRPTVALLYVIFVLLFLLGRAIAGAHALSAEELAVNAELRRRMPESNATFRDRIVFYFRLRERLNEAYRRLVLKRWFSWMLIIGFVAMGVYGLATVEMEIARRGTPDIGGSLVPMAASAASIVCIWIGVWRLAATRIGAYTWFRRSVLVNIYLTEVFTFYHAQFAALRGLAVNLLVYAALRYMISREENPV